MPTTPGVYIQEINSFPISIVAVETAIPLFIGYTEKAWQNGQSLINKPTRIQSFDEYRKLFGNDFKSKFKIVEKTQVSERTIKIGNKDFSIRINENENFIFYKAIQLFYANGGKICYILSVKTYDGTVNGFAIDLNDFNTVLELLEKEAEPTLIVLPDVITKGVQAYNLYHRVLLHCQKMQNRFAILDVHHQFGKSIEEESSDFRESIGVDGLHYGAAYYPYLHTSLVNVNEVDFDNIDASIKLDNLLPERAAKIALKNFYKLPANASAGNHTVNNLDFKITSLNTRQDIKARNKLHKKLLSVSPAYFKILEEIRFQLNILPPSAAMAGIYTMVDQTRGVWKAPANISLSMVNAPAINLTQLQREHLNINVNGKSINAIRQFTGVETLVWGARTLDGNSIDWKYINVRRTIIMLEQSIKNALASYVFEPNNITTWTAINISVSNFLHILWKQGALHGNVPQQAFAVQTGLGITMTETDITKGILRLNVLLALARPAEFVNIVFQQQQMI